MLVPIPILLRAVKQATVCLVCQAALGSLPAAAQLPDQSFEVVPEADSAAVGDPVSLRFRVRLDERDLLYDTVPKPIGDLPPGVRILSVEKLRRGADRIYTGHALVAFYRTGRRATPIFGLPFMRAVKGVTRAELPSESAFVTIAPVAPPGNPQLKDIKDIARRGRLDPLLVAGGLGAAAAAVVLLLLVKRRAAAPPPGAARPDPAARIGPYDVALARLTELERRGAGDSRAYHEGIANVLRDYLENVDAARARRYTTSELLAHLPGSLVADRLGEECRAFFDEADLVKFGRVGRSDTPAARHADRARAILREWHERGCPPRGSTDGAVPPATASR